MINFKASLIFLILDIIWITSNIDKYNNLVNMIQKKNMILNNNKIISLLITYLILLFGLNYIVIPYKVPISFGFVVYGVYSFTNYTMYEKYPIKLAILDTLWGILLYYLSYYYK